MSDDGERYESFLGTGWSFPPRFVGSGAVMVSAEADIHESLVILFGTAAGTYGVAPAATTAPVSAVPIA